MRSYILVCFIAGICTSLQAQSDTSITSRFQFLIGTWEIPLGEEMVVEVWQSTHPDTLIGCSYLLSGGDRDTLEIISITRHNGVIAYGAKVIGENNGQTVYFPYIGMEKGWHVFQNLSHDYPTNIAYMLMETNVLDAYISGPGDSRPARFRYKRSEG